LALAAVLRADEGILVRELRSLGFDVESVRDFVNAGSPHEFLRSRVSPDYEAAFPVLVRHLGVEHHARIREGIIRALTIRKAPAPVWRALLAEFEAESDPSLRWVLANSLRRAMPTSERRKRPEIHRVFRRGGVV
jgi:hypothetical protein